jgi:dipeptidyl aminopeptidase/acylaminoacyl peptidase
MDYALEFVHWENKGITIRATQYVTNNKTAPWVILCHGFTSHRIGPSYFFVALGRYLASSGVNALTFDFAGCGESEGQFTDITVSSLCSDLVSAYRFVNDSYNPSKLFILGHSFGGTVAVLSLDIIAIDGLILISPLADIQKHIQLHEHILKKGKNKDGYYEYGSHEMKIDFLNELRKCDPLSVLSSDSVKRIILFQGDSDEDIPVEESQVYVDKARELDIDTVYHIVKDADHRFLSVNSRTFLQNTIADWIKESF